MYIYSTIAVLYYKMITNAKLTTDCFIQNIKENIQRSDFSIYYINKIFFV